MVSKRRTGLKQFRWRVTLRGQPLGVVFADNYPAACARAVRRWQLSRDDRQELVMERDVERLQARSIDQS